MKSSIRALSSLSSWVVQPVAVVLFLVVGFAAASRLSLRKEPPRRAEAAVYAPLVRTRTAEPRSHRVRVQGHGSLAARTRIDLVSQVGGEVVAIHPGFRAGGRFRAGEVLARIEPRDYELAVARAEAQVSSAETQVVTLAAESEAAVNEWNRLRAGQEVPALVSLEPQQGEAAARVLAAAAELESARLDLARTELALPFDGRVVSAAVDVGQVIAANQPLGVVYATEVFEVVVPLRVEALGWLSLPGVDAEVPGAGPGPGSSATVRGTGPGGALEVRGRIARVFGELDGTSRLARVVVEIPTAALAPEAASRLLPGTFVDVEFEGAVLEDVVELPRSALRLGGVVWVVEDGVLAFARPAVLRAEDGALLVEGLAPGAEVVTSHLEVVTEGMRVRAEDEREEGAR